MAKIPSVVFDVLMHTHDAQHNEIVVLPFTRYKNIFNAPKVVTGANEVLSAPFALYAEDDEELTLTEIRELCGGLL